jgi:hypothetical protein
VSKILQCTLCEEKFEEKAIKDLKFFPSTMICSNCYDEAEKDKSVCFGKKKQYDKKSIVCSKICSDRRVCKLYIRMQHAE